jgi:hypothetical protein
MMNDDKKDPVKAYEEKYRAIVDAYGKQMDFSSEAFKRFPMDVIEIESDIDCVGAVLRSVGDGKLGDRAFYQAMCALAGRLWHLAEHIQSLDTAITLYLDSEDEGQSSVEPSR